MANEKRLTWMPWKWCMGGGSAKGIMAACGKEW